MSTIEHEQTATTVAPEAPPFDPDALRDRYREERDKRVRPDGNEQYREVTGDFARYLEDPVRRADRARAADRRGRRGHRRRWLRRAARRRPPAPGRRRRHPDHREGRRLRRHLVLEPLPGRDVRRRVVHLPAAARGARLRPEGEVHPRAGDPGPQPQHRRALRPVPQRLLPDRGHRDALGRRRGAVDRLDQPRRRDARPLRRDGQRAAAPSEAAGDRRDRDVPGPHVPHQPVGLRLHRRRLRRRASPAWPASASGSSARAPRRCSASRTSPRAPSTSTCSSARRRRSTCATTATPIRTGRRASGRAGRSSGWTTSTRWCPAASPTRTWSTTGGPTSSASCW